MNARSQQFFSLFFLGRMTHDSLNNAYYVDDPLHNLLSRLFEEQLLNNTIVFVLGDHGLRYGSFVWGTLMGQMESRLPLMSIYLPPKYRYDSWVRNLKTNQNRLTSNFDIHATLMHLSGANRKSSGKANSKSEKGLKEDKKETKGISLFEEIPVTRTCEDAGIPEEYCCCLQPQAVKNDKLINTVCDFIIETLNSFIEPVEKFCHKLSLLRLVSISEHQYKSNKITNEERIFSAVIQASPSKGHFQATVQVAVKKKKKVSLVTTKDMKMLGDVIRVDKYGNQSACVEPTMPHRFILKNICLCKNGVF